MGSANNLVAHRVGLGPPRVRRDDVGGLKPTLSDHLDVPKALGPRFRGDDENRVRSLRARQSTYTNMKSPSHTTSTKCQYQATASNAKW